MGNNIVGSLINDGILSLVGAEEAENTKDREMAEKYYIEAESAFRKIQLARFIFILKIVQNDRILQEEDDLAELEENLNECNDYLELAGYFLSTTKTANYEDINSSSTSKKTSLFQKIADFLANKRRG